MIQCIYALYCLEQKIEPGGGFGAPSRRRKCDTKFDTNTDEFRRQRRTKIGRVDTQGKRAMSTERDSTAQNTHLTHLDESGNIHMVDVTDRPSRKS
jgi:hypothetical protein